MIFRCLLLCTVLCAATGLAAESITLDNTPTYGTTVTPTITGGFSGFGGNNVGSIVVEVISGGVTVATATDNTPNNATNGSFSVSPSGGMALGNTYDLRITAWENDAGGGAQRHQQSFAGALVLDGVAPTLNAVTVLDPSPASAGPIRFQLQFSEAVRDSGTGFVDASDVTVVGTGGAGATITGVTGTGTTRTVTVSTLTGNGTIGLALAGGATIRDLAGNTLTTPATPTPDQTYVTDTTAPRLATITRLNANPTGLGTVSFAVTFSEPVVNVVAARFTASGPVTTGVITISGSGQAYIVDVPITAGAGSLGLTLNAGAIEDLAGNDLTNVAATGTTQTYTVQNAAPTVTSITRVTGSPTDANSLQFLVTFSTTVIGGVAANFVPQVSGVAHGTVNVSGSGSTRTITVSTITGNGTLGLSVVTAPVIEDGLGVGLASGTPTGANESYVVDNTAPQVTSITRLDGSPTNVASVQFLVTFSEPVTNVIAARFSANTTGTVTTGAIGLSGSGQAYTVTVPVPSGEGTLGLTMTTTGIIDAASNNLGSGTPTGANQTYAVDRTAPTVSDILRLDPSPTGVDSVRFLVTFSEPMSGVTAASFSPAPSAAVSVSPTVVINGSGNTYTVTVNTIFSASTGSLGLNVVAAGLTDVAGNLLAVVAPTGLNQAYAITQSAPSLSYTFGGDVWSMFEGHPSTVSAPTWDLGQHGGFFPNSINLGGTWVPFNYIGNFLGWFPLNGYAPYTTLIAPPDLASTPPQPARSLPHFFLATFSNLGDPIFTPANETGSILFRLALDGLTPVAAGTVRDDHLDTITFNDVWQFYYNDFYGAGSNIVFDHGARTITQSGNQIATWAAVGGDPRQILVTIGHPSVSVSTDTVRDIIRLAEGRIGGRNPSATDRLLTAEVTNVDARVSNTITARLRPIRYDDNARVDAGPAIDDAPAPLVVLPGITRTGSVAVDDVDSAFSFVVTTAPTQGSLTIDASTGFFSYAADLGSTGSDTFTITVTDLGPPGGNVWYGQPLIPTTPVTYEVVIADPFDPDAPAIRSNPPFEIAADDTLTYPLTFTPVTPPPDSEVALIGLDPAAFDPSERPNVAWNGTTWVLTWPQVPTSATGYYDFGLLLTVEDTSLPPPRPLRATYQPVLLKVRAISGGG